ncbi:MAG TPA: SprT-like domain-containing protein [Myxococcota bacterium]
MASRTRPTRQRVLWNEQLEHQLLETLVGAWHTFNRDLFGGGLTMPVLLLEDTSARLGHWRRRDRTIGLSRPLIRDKPWHVVRAVLKHEMAHQYVDEVLGVLDSEPAHGPAFARVCADLHIDARASGMPDDDDADIDVDAHDDDTARIMRRVQKLLALADSDNANEAEAAANAAQRLMLEHNLAGLQKRGAKRYATKRLTTPVVRLPAHIKMLAGVLSRSYFVEVVLARAYLPDEGRDGFLVEVSGTPENLAMAEWVFHFLCDAGDRVFDKERRAGRVTSSSRPRFLTGFVAGVDEKLARDRAVQQEQGLVWIGDPDLQRWVRREHPRLRATRVRTAVDDAHRLGRAAGNDVVIARPVEAASVQRGRLLT